MMSVVCIYLIILSLTLANSSTTWRHHVLSSSAYLHVDPEFYSKSRRSTHPCRLCVVPSPVVRRSDLPIKTKKSPVSFTSSHKTFSICLPFNPWNIKLKISGNPALLSSPLEMRSHGKGILLLASSPLNKYMKYSHYHLLL